MTIAVTAATGHVGSHVVRLLIQAGVRPTVLVLFRLHSHVDDGWPASALPSLDCLP